MNGVEIILFWVRNWFCLRVEGREVYRGKGIVSYWVDIFLGCLGRLFIKFSFLK